MSNREPPTPESLRAAVSRAMQRKSCDLDTAFGIVAAELGQSLERLSAWWEVFGPWWCQQVYAASAGKVASVAPPSEPAQAETRKRSWREKVSNPMDIQMPVGKTGARKRLGDFTRDDCLVIAAVYTDKAIEAATASEAWVAFAAKMQDGETLENTSLRLQTSAPLRRTLRTRKPSENAIDEVLSLNEETAHQLVGAALRYAALAPEHPKASPLGYLNTAVEAQDSLDAENPDWILEDVAAWLEEQEKEAAHVDLP